MLIRGIRGAITVQQDSPDEILAATRQLLQTIEEANPTLKPSDLAGALFTVTHDLKTAFPAQAARQMGWDLVPLMCAQEIPVPGSLKHCIRVLLLWNTDQAQNEINHVYLGEAASLRPEFAQTTIKQEVSKC
jgi:chorismate mutase